VKNITFLGDSLTAGYGLKNYALESVPALIQQKIDRQGLDYTVFNAGMSGSTSSNGLYRLDAWLRRPIDIFILELGINDLIRNVPVERTRKNMEAIVEKVLARNPGCKMALMGMRLPKNTRSPVADKFNQMYPQLAEKYSMVYVPFFLEGVAGKRELNLPDGLHPNAAGYVIIAENIWPAIHEMLTS
jgi:acyl-CoA thioesterase-1